VFDDLHNDTAHLGTVAAALTERRMNMDNKQAARRTWCLGGSIDDTIDRS
jgi:hypothetical protein